MSVKKDARSIGVFTLVAIFLLLAGFVAFNSSDWFSDEVRFEMVFPGEITGLSKGSAVSFRGAKLGEVSSIDFEFDQANQEVLIVVVAKFKQPRKGYLSDQDFEDFLNQQIAQGLKAQLVVGSLVTGSLQIKLEYLSELPSEPTVSYRGYTAIPTVPTDFQQLEQSFQKIAEVMRKMPIGEVVENVRNITESLKEMTQNNTTEKVLTDLAESTEHIRNILNQFDEDKKAIIDEWQTTVAQTGKTAASIEVTSNRVAELVDSGKFTLSKLDDVLISVNDAVITLQKTVDSDSEMSISVIRTLESVDRAANQMRDLTLTIQQNPESLISGRQ